MELRLPVGGWEILRSYSELTGMAEDEIASCALLMVLLTIKDSLVSGIQMLRTRQMEEALAGLSSEDLKLLYKMLGRSNEPA